MARPRAFLCFLCTTLGLAMIWMAWAREQPNVTPAPVAPVPPGPEVSSLERGFQATVQPFLTTYCTSCHGGAKPKGDLDLTRYASAEAVAQDLRRWETVLEQLETGMMPPGKAKQHPTPDERR